MITVSDVVNAYKKTNLEPGVVIGIEGQRCHPMVAILIGRGLKQDSIYDYFGADFVTEFNRGFYDRPIEKAYDKEAYEQGKNIRDKIIAGTLLTVA